MCTHKRYIVNSHGKRILVKCGKCEACLQEKAIQRSNRIRNNISKFGDTMCLFVTLTYRNSAVPYFDLEEWKSSPVVSNPFSLRSSYRVMKVYRDIVARRDYKKGFKYHHSLLHTLCVDDIISKRETLFKTLRNDHSRRKRVGVCYHPDLQMSLKRLRQNLKRKYHYEKSFTYFACSEYGPRTMRPHFHLLIFVKGGLPDFEMWKDSIATSWPFDGYGLTQRNIEVARDAASYVSSYVNCSTYIPSLFRNCRELRPSHSYSQGFGMALEYLSLPSVLEAYKRGDLHVSVSRLREGVPVVDDILLPQYVLSRYFPKFKGYCSLSSHEINSILLRPSSIYEYAFRLSLDRDDCRKIEVLLRNKREFAALCGVNLFDYCEAYSRIHALRSSQVLRDMYADVSDFDDYFTLYDNIADLYDGSVSNDSLENLMLCVHPDFAFPVDYNSFPNVVHDSQELTRMYYEYDKSRKINNRIYSQFNSDF